jgi:hypothetical protein
MPTPQTQGKAAELERQLATLTGHQSARVKPYGKHLLIQMRSDANDDSVDTIARLTELGRNSTPRHFAATPADGNRCPAPAISPRPPSWSSRCWVLTSNLILKAI